MFWPRPLRRMASCSSVWAMWKFLINAWRSGMELKSYS